MKTQTKAAAQEKPTSCICIEEAYLIAEEIKQCLEAHKEEFAKTSMGDLINNWTQHHLDKILYRLGTHKTNPTARAHR